MIKKVWTILPALAAFVASPAYAQVADFSPRVEVRAGYDELRAELEIENGRFTSDASEHGIGYGVEVGIDARLSSTFLLGVYAGLDFSDVDGCSDVFGGDEACLDAGRNFTAGLRAGLPMGDGSLIYVKGGYSHANIRASYLDDVDDINSGLFADSDGVSGYHLGAGVELGLGVLGLSPNLYAKGEYVHTRYKEAFKSELGAGESFNPTRHQLLVGVGMRF